MEPSEEGRGKVRNLGHEGHPLPFWVPASRLQLSRANDLPAVPDLTSAPLARFWGSSRDEGTFEVHTQSLQIVRPNGCLPVSLEFSLCL